MDEIKIQKKCYERCLRCGRHLKSDEAKERGFGVKCWEKFIEEEPKYKNLFGEENV